MSVYCDYNATTPVAASVIKKITDALERQWGNPSSVYSLGNIAKESIREARSHIANMIHARPDDVIFTSGGTEANNMVLFGIVEYYKNFTSSKMTIVDNSRKPHVITTNVEHDAVIEPLKYLQKKGDIDLSIIPVSENGRICVQDIIGSVNNQTCMITVMHANNVTGVIMPVNELGRALKKVNKERETRGLIKILYHTDSAQAIGKIPVDVDALQVDYLTIVGHKFYGPRIGALYVRGPGSVSDIQPLLYGGGQERGWRPGTENTAMIVGLGEAAHLVCENLDVYNEHMLNIRDYLESKLVETFGKDGININCSHPDVERLPNTCNISLIGEGLHGNTVLSKCKHLMASTNSACHEQNKPSSILLASGIQPDTAANAIRLSVGRETTKADIDLIVNDLKQAALIVQENKDNLNKCCENNK